MVEEDALDQWPAGPLDVVGRPAARIDGRERARGQARRTPPTSGCPGCSTRRCCAARTRARACAGSTSRAALALPGVRAALGPDDVDELTAEPPLRGRAGRGRRGRHVRRRRAPRSRRSRSSGSRSSRCSTRDEAVARGVADAGAAPHERGDVERGLRRGGRRRRGRVPDADVVHNAMETHQAVCHWRDADHLEALRLDAVRLGRPRRARRALRPRAGPRARRLRGDGRRLRREERRRPAHEARRRARARARAGPSAAR